ncbi:RNA 2'-phosphotransferase [Pseudanabaena sp. UWO310]|uniref:RNA 2'-phosphotransferase n=1 Tax=Pseudanabaena sp. UWO310 TaxID=2480795 RepID=UPI00115BBE33|nr:RNA 2'-phosphotransferase [Pseudanabaena sp. UWO310]TYQ32080.1 RNA 2'-phosphotransferase [Pseudanabaena sp. UWO310]
MDKNLVHLSKFMSLVLRHQPEIIGLTLDEHGWVEVDRLIELAKRNGTDISIAQLEEIVATNDKKRFAFNPEKSKIRANQGHSLQVTLDLNPQLPPNPLFHGTATRFLDSIRQQGLLAGKRQHVHLSADVATAIKVGQRHGKPVVLQVDTLRMHQDGLVFFCSENSVWLTESVPPQYLEFPDQ